MKTETVILLAVAVAGVVYFVVKRKQAAPTAYYGGAGGSVGGYGVQTHVPVATAGVALGGLLGAGLASWFGGGASSAAGIAPDANTPTLGARTISNPVYPSPSILPYSYKQQVIDTPAILGTDSIFTPQYSSTDSSTGGLTTSYVDQGTSSDTNLGGTSTYWG